MCTKNISYIFFKYKVFEKTQTIFRNLISFSDISRMFLKPEILLQLLFSLIKHLIPLEFGSRLCF